MLPSVPTSSKAPKKNMSKMTTSRKFAITQANSFEDNFKTLDKFSDIQEIQSFASETGWK